MSFLRDIQTFSQSGLKATPTEVTFVDGRRVREVKDPASGCVTSEVLDNGLGFVGDYKPDLQVAEIMPGLYLGSQDVAADLPILLGNGISHILNAASMLDNNFPLSFTYLRLDLLDLLDTYLPDIFPQAFEFIDEGRKAGKVFVHCNAGVSRAASIVIAYKMRTDKLGFQEVYDHVKSVRPAIRPNDGFTKQLKEYKPWVL